MNFLNQSSDLFAIDDEPRNDGTEPHLIVVEYESTIPIASTTTNVAMIGNASRS